MACRPALIHAADYIAQQHDIAYATLGLSGFPGTINVKSREADDILLQQCDEIIAAQKAGDNFYESYALTKETTGAAEWMKLYFK